MIRVVIVDDHDVVLHGLRALVETRPDMQVVGTAKTIREARSLCQKLRPHVMILDLRLPDSTGIGEIALFKEENPKMRIVVLTGAGVRHKDAALKFGADDFLSKEEASSKIIGILASSSEEPQVPSAHLLSAREADVARLAASGLSNPEIANALGVSVNTIKTHLSNILEKLNVPDRTSLALLWAREPQ